MVLLGYTRKPSLLCVEEKKIPSINSLGYSSFNGASSQSPALSGNPWGVLGPAAKILRGGAGKVNNTLLQLRDGLNPDERRAKAKKEERQQILTLRMKNAETLEQWRAAACELDALEDNEAWKADTQSEDFDALLIESRLKQLDTARVNCDMARMLYLVRTALSRDLGGIGNIRLYKHSHVGTKYLIERYIDSTLETIQALLDYSKHSLSGGLEPKDTLEQVVYARQSFGRSALLLSGGATYGMNHIGVLKALFETKLLPRIISGASAGSIVCSIVCTRKDEEIPDLLKNFPYGDLAVFEEEGNEEGVFERVQRLLTQGAWIDIKHLTRVMQDLLGDMTFQESYNRTRRILNIPVSSASIYELPRLLNYVTAPNVMIWSAVAASCSVPLVFSTAQLLVKSPLTGEHEPWNPTPQHWIDGSVDNDLPMTRLAEMFNINHFIVSQVNPHIVPFLAQNDKYISKDAEKSGDTRSGWIFSLTNLAKDETLHRMQMLAEIGIFPNLVSKCRSILSQKYSGDITILPEINYNNFHRLLKNPTSDFMLESCLAGERATWPKLSRIKDHCAVELALDSAVQTLRARVVFSPSQVDLRRMRVGTSTSDAGRGRAQKRSNSSSKVDAEVVGENPHNEAGPAPRAGKKDEKPVVNAERHSSSDQKRTVTPPSLFRQISTPIPRSRNNDMSMHPLTPTRQRKRLDLENLVLDSSAGETNFSEPSSELDKFSQTDESSPDLEAAPSWGSYHSNTSRKRTVDGPEVDFFSASQPVTAPSDHVLATSSVTSSSTFGFGVESSDAAPDLKAVAGLAIQTTISEPERRYKQLFHGTT